MLQRLIGNFAGIGGAPQDSSQKPFPSHVGITDGDAAYDTMAEVLAIIGALAAGSVWTKVWEKTVPAQQRMRWGFGVPAYNHNQGYMWFCVLDTNVDFEVGVLRLMQNTARETKPVLVAEIDDTRLHTATVTTLATATPTNINEMYALPEQRQHPMVGEDSRLQLWYRCVTVATAEDNLGFSIPVTTYQ